MADGDLLKNALIKISERVELSGDPRSDPARFVRDVHKRWKDEGGKVGGKPRHSDRFLENCLSEQRVPVRSLTPKLVGKTRIQPDDAEALMRVFLSKWPVLGANGGDIEYKPFLSNKEIDAVTAHSRELIEANETPLSAVVSPQESSQSLPGEDIGGLITRFFEEADALITISPEHTLITQPKTELIGFRNLMNGLMAIERRDKKARPLIWVLDLGDQLFEDLDARRKYLNVQTLIGRFKALKRFHERGFEKRWEWLQSRAVIVLLDTVGFFEEGSADGHSRVLRPDFQAQNATLSAVATDWLASNEFRALYGRDLDQLNQRSFSVFFNASADWMDPPKWERSDLRYFGYASFADKGNVAGRGVELPPLPYRYTEGFRAVAMAGAHALQLTYQMPEHQASEYVVSGAEAVDQLRYLGFQILRLEEFLKNY